MFLLGAGASVAAGVPATVEMTKRIADTFGDDLIYSHLLRFVIGGLLLQKGVRGEDPFQGVDVEELFSAVLLLGERRTLEAAPFVGSWHSMVDQLDRAAPSRWQFERLNKVIAEGVTRQIVDALPSSVSGFDHRDVDKSIEKATAGMMAAMVKGRTPSISSFDSVGKAVGAYFMKLTSAWLDKARRGPVRSTTDFKREFSRAVEESVRSGEGEVFRNAAEQMTRALTKIVWIESADKVAYLKPLLTVLDSQQRLVVATLNYDNSVELMASSSSVPCDTGIAGWSSTGSFERCQEGIGLLKLHGSIDWAWQGGGTGTDQLMPHRVLEAVDPIGVDSTYYEPAVIFGQRMKLTAEGPFLDLLRAFRDELATVDRLIVVGYSFRDPHVNTYISHWLNQEENRKMTIVNPGFDSSQVDYVTRLKQCCANRLEVVGKPIEEVLVEIVGS